MNVHKYQNMNDFLLYRSYIQSLGDFFELNCDINHDFIKEYCYHSQNNLVDYYLPRTKGIALTNLTGEHDASGFIPLSKNNYNEMDFTSQTQAYRESGMCDLLDKFNNDLGRSHILNTQQGGGFYPHRDGPKLSAPKEETFRLIYCIDACDENNMHFGFENRIILPMVNGKLYYVNTVKKHSQISFNDNCFFTVINIAITKESYIALRRLMK